MDAEFPFTSHILPDDLDTDDPRSGRAAVAPLNHRLDRFSTSLEHGLHATIRDVPDPSGNAAEGGLFLDIGSKIDPLNASRHPDVGPDPVGRRLRQRHRGNSTETAARARRPAAWTGRRRAAFDHTRIEEDKTSPYTVDREIFTVTRGSSKFAA